MSRPRTQAWMAPPAPRAARQAWDRSCSSLGTAGWRFASSLGWGAASVASVPFVALVPPLWAIPAYFGFRSARAMGRGAYDAGVGAYEAGRAAVVLPAAGWLAENRHMRALRDGSAACADRRWRETIDILGPVLAEVCAAAGYERPQSDLYEALIRFYFAGVRGWLGEFERGAAQQQELAAVLFEADDDGFVRAFEELVPEDRALAVCLCGEEDAAGNLLELAVTYDCPRAWALLYHALHMAEPVMGPWLADLRKKYQPDAVADRAVEEQLPRLALACVMESTLTIADFCRTFRRYADGDHPVVRAAVRSLTAHGLVSASNCLLQYRDCELMRELVRSGEITDAEVMLLGQTHLRAALRDMFITTAQGAARMCVLGALDTAQALELVSVGLLEPALAVQHLQIEHATVQQWYTDGQLALEAYLPEAMRHFRPTAPLEPALIAHAEHFFETANDFTATAERLAALWETLRDAPMATRMSLVSRSSALALTGPAPTHVAPEPPAECQVCFIPFGPDAPPVRSAHCDHTPSVCGACVAQQAEIGGTQICMMHGCKAAHSPNDLLQAGVPSDRIDALCIALVRDRLAAVPHRRHCWTTDCIGGAQVLPGEELHYDCPLCARTSLLACRTLDTEKDLQHVRKLIQDVGSIANMNGAMRECYWCGSATEHGTACAHMVCTKCKQDWDFNRGPMNGNMAGQYHPLAQAYVPRSGLLIDIGLYDGLQPGSYNHQDQAIANHVRERARAKGLLQEPIA